MIELVKLQQFSTTSGEHNHLTDITLYLRLVYYNKIKHNKSYAVHELHLLLHQLMFCLVPWLYSLIIFSEIKFKNI